MLPKKVNDIINALSDANFEFDFYIEPHKHRQIKQFILNEFEGVSIELKAEIDYVCDEYTGGDWDEILTDFIETSRKITVINAYDEQDEIIALSEKEKLYLEDYLTKKIEFKLY